MKLFFAFFMCMTAMCAVVDGAITYKVPNGELATRDVSLTVPPRGQGEVILSGKGFEWKTDQFFSYKRLGQTVFIAAFKTEFMDKQSTVVFKGTYLRGSNAVVYNGDFYKKSGHSFFQLEDLAGFRHTGVFSFQTNL